MLRAMTSSELRAPATTRTAAGRAASKVPEITIYFWIIKLLTTGMGEAAADWVQELFRPMLAVALTGLLLLASVVGQLWVRRYIAWVYWTAVVMVSVFGTIAADVVRHKLDLSHEVNTLIWTVLLAAVFVAWYLSERTLSIHSIHTFRRELFYWATVMATFALGTAAGDWTAKSVGLGWLDSAILFSVAMAVPALAHRFAGLNAVLAFWAAYVLTRPVGASFADWFSADDGLNWGKRNTTVVMTVLIVAFVAYLAITRRDVEPDVEPDA
jgi:uncharacterized membrane-anchored protein